MRYTYCRLWNMAKNTVKCGKCEIHTLGAGIWQENLNTWKSVKCTLYDLDNGKKNQRKQKTKTKKKNKLKNVENETQTVNELNMARKIEKL